MAILPRPHDSCVTSDDAHKAVSTSASTSAPDSAGPAVELGRAVTATVTTHPPSVTRSRFSKPNMSPP